MGDLAAMDLVPDPQIVAAALRACCSFCSSQSSFFRLRGVSLAVGLLRGAQVDLMYISAGEGLLFNFFWGGHQVFITNPTTNRQCCWSCRHSRSSWSASSGGSVTIAGPAMVGEVKQETELRSPTIQLGYIGFIYGHG